MREKVKFSQASPTVVKLDFNDGTPVNGRNGEQQYQYMCNDDASIMYVDAPIRDYILAAGCKAGDLVAITKHGPDARQWEVVRTSPQPSTITAAMAAARPAAARPAAAAPVEVTPQSIDLVAALKSAIDAAIEAERYAGMQAHPITFSAEDIRTMANSTICRRQGNK
jgi:hypothetical protein